ncbi:MAG: NrtA/SsuA/CpmA family ABC transporter substrate-binding protein [Lachnospiraceae bacterium]|nr:NrtA/SsuA/CpmA family ABC transporter substrate-binding protein [Lachnospiraceae bacterium]
MKKKKRKQVSFLFAMLILVAALAGCSKQGEKDQSPVSTPVPPTKKAETPEPAGDKNVSAEFRDTDGEGNSFEIAAYKDIETPENEKNIKKIRIGALTGIYFGATLKLAYQLGLFEQEFGPDGIEIELTYFSSGPPAREAMAAGEIDFSTLGDLPALSGYAGGVDYRVISTDSVSDTIGGILVKADSDIKSLNDLNGKTIAVGIGTTQQKIFLQMIASVGLSENEVSEANISGSTALASIETGDVDGWFTYEPNIYRNVDSGALRLLEKMNGYPSVMYVLGMQSFISEHPNITARFLQVLQRATEYLAAHPEESYTLLQQTTETDYGDLSRYFNEFEWGHHLTSDDVEVLRTTNQFVVDHEIAPAVDLKAFVDDSYLKRAFEYR